MSTLPTLAAEPIPRPELEGIYRRELEGLYRPADSEKVRAAHEQLEAFFAATSAADRTAAVGDIAKLGLDVNLLGRLCRLRTRWPAIEPGAYFVNERVGPHRVRYALGVPKGYDRTRSWPLVVKLPPAGALATDPPPDAGWVTGAYTGWVNDELARHPDALVLMPLPDFNAFYAASADGMSLLIQPMLHAAGRANVDPARVCVVGHATGAHAAWNLALHYPTYFAAFAALAGTTGPEWQRVRLINLRNVLAVVWQDTGDDVIKIARPRALVKAMRGQKLDVEYDETSGVGHTPTDAVADAAYAKARARTRILYPQQVWLQSNRPDTMFNRVDWVQVYQPLSAGPERRLLVRRGGGSMRVNQNKVRVDAAVVKPNRIEVKADNVAAMRIYLNDRMVDFAKPVTIVVNRKAKFEGMVTPSLEEMLNDQRFLGRGWRYFGAVIDLDLRETPPPSTQTASPLPKAAAPPATKPGAATPGT